MPIPGTVGPPGYPGSEDAPPGCSPVAEFQLPSVGTEGVGAIVSGTQPSGPPAGLPHAAAPTAHRVRSVLAIPAFRRLWLVTAVSATGDWLSLLALSALATQLATGYQAQSFALGGVVATKLLPALVLGPLAGALADKFDRRRVMVVCDLLRFGLFLSIPLVGSLWWLLVATLLIEICALFWIPAKDASVPNLLRRPDQIETANQLALVMTYGVAVITASGLFTVISGLGGFLPGSTPEISTAYVALILNGLAYLLTATTVWFGIREISGRAAQRREAAPGLVALLRDGCAVRREHAAGPRAGDRDHRGVHRRWRRHRLGDAVRRQPRRRQRRVRDAVHRRLRRPGDRHGRRAAAVAAAAAQPPVRHRHRRGRLRAGAGRARPAPDGRHRRGRAGRRLRRDRLPHRPDDHRRPGCRRGARTDRGVRAVDRAADAARLDGAGAAARRSGQRAHGRAVRLPVPHRRHPRGHAGRRRDRRGRRDVRLPADGRPAHRAAAARPARRAAPGRAARRDPGC